MIFYFHPEPWGNDPIWRSYFSDGWFNHQLVDDFSGMLFFGPPETCNSNQKMTQPDPSTLDLTEHFWSLQWVFVAEVLMRWSRLINDLWDEYLMSYEFHGLFTLYQYISKERVMYGQITIVCIQTILIMANYPSICTQNSTKKNRPPFYLTAAVAPSNARRCITCSKSLQRNRKTPVKPYEIWSWTKTAGVMIRCWFCCWYGCQPKKKCFLHPNHPF